MACPPLPLELIEAIVNEVACKGDTTTLKSCALAAYAFTSPAQKHLFRRIDFDKRHPRKKAFNRFFRLISSKPRLGSYVRDLLLVDDSDDDHHTTGGRYSISASLGSNSARTWMMASASHIPHALQLLPLLESLSLTFNADIADWRDVPPSTRAAFERAFHLPTLRSVRLEFVHHFPQEVLGGLMQLKHLFLSCVEVAPGGLGLGLTGPDHTTTSNSNPSTLSRVLSNFIHTHAPNQAHILHSAPSSISEPLSPTRRKAPGPIRLQSLFLRGTPATTIDAITEALRASSESNDNNSEPSEIKRLCITPTYESGFCEAVNEVIRVTHTSLTALEWLPSVHFATSSAPIDISNVPNLTYLRFIVSFRRSQGNNSFSDVLRLLEQVSTDEPSSSSTISTSTPTSTSTANTSNSRLLQSSESVPHDQTPTPATTTLPPKANQIRTIILDCYCLRRKLESRSFQIGWERLEAVLSREAFTELKEVRVMMSLNDSQDLYCKFAEFFRGMFGVLREKGVRVSLEDHDERKVGCSSIQAV